MMVELSKPSSNVGYNMEIQYRLQRALVPEVEKGLKALWGNDWANQLNIRRGNAKRSSAAMEIVDGKPVWDTNTLLYAIREFGRNMPNVDPDFAGSLRSWCWDLRESRNAPSHFGVENYHDVNSDHRLGYQSVLAMKLLKAFHCHEEAAEIESLMSHSWARNGTGMDTTKSGADSKAAKEVSETILATAAEPKVHKTPTVQTVRTLTTEAAETRRTPLPDPGDGIVVFPLVGQDALMAEDTCLASASAKSFTGEIQFSLPTGINGNEATFYQIMRDVREYEPDDKILEKTRVHFDFKFMGNSFGVAVALADRSRRYGFDDKVKDRRIIATGCVKPKKGGEVGAIDGFPEKIAIVHKFAPPGTLFIFPNENLGAASSATRTELERLKDRTIAWRGISHIDDLNDLLAEYPGREEVAKTAENSKTTAAPAEETTPLYPVAQEPAPVIPLARRRTFSSRMLAGSALSAIALMVAAYGASSFLERRQQDIAAVQTSDEHLQRLARTASDVKPGAETGDTCENLVAASNSITQYDIDRFEDVHRQALAQSKECTSLLAASDTKLKTLIEAFNEAEGNEQPGSIVKLAEARTTLVPLDISRVTTDDMKAAMASGDRAVAQVKESDRRIAAFNSQIAAWSKDNADGKAADAAAAAYEELQPFDLQRPASAASVNTEPARRLVSLLGESDARINEAILFASAVENSNTTVNRQAVEQRLANLTGFDISRLTAGQKASNDRARDLLRTGRWNAFETAAKSYGADKTADNTLQFTAAFSNLTPADRITFADQISDYRSLIDQTQRDLLESDGRLQKLQAAYDALNAAEKKKGGSPGALYQLLADTVAALTDFDRRRLSGATRAAVSRADAVGTELAASDKRINNSQVWAEIVLKGQASGTVSRKVMESAKAARAALTPFDIDRMTPDQKQALEIVCAVPVEKPKRGVLPALAGFECFKPGDFKPRMLPAIR